jgi:choline/glycine/proline betaine transport protein
VFLRTGGQAYNVYGYRKSELIHDILDQLGHYLTVLEHTPGILPWQGEPADDDELPAEH